MPEIIHNKAEYPPMHTAEHILNQTMGRLLGCPRSRNTHIERKKSKCDYLLAQAPSPEQIQEIEDTVNRIIAQDLDVSTEFVTREEAKALVDLSKLPSDDAPTLRLVRVGDYDVCACIGAHVNHTMEIGTFRIISSDFTDGVWRVRFKLENSSFE